MFLYRTIIMSTLFGEMGFVSVTMFPATLKTRSAEPKVVTNAKNLQATVHNFGKADWWPREETVTKFFKFLAKKLHLLLISQFLTVRISWTKKITKVFPYNCFFSLFLQWVVIASIET